MTEILLTRPMSDIVTTYLSTWANDVIKVAEQKGMKVLDLKEGKATKSDFEKYCKKQTPSFVHMCGHGSPESVRGHKNEIVLSKDNAVLMKDKIVHTLACEAAQDLGPTLCEKGAKAMIGYSQQFAFVTSSIKECKPDKDNLANVFREASNQVPLSIIKGQTVKEAFERSQAKYDEQIAKFSSSDATKEESETRFWLFWNKDVQKICGDEEAKID